MFKLIINADDCGYSKYIDNRIENAILKRRITSTTIMANMDDFNGAIELYNTYKEVASFGFHVNLTEGSPLLYNQQLLDKEFYVEKDDKIFFNAQPFRRQLLSKQMRLEIYKEVCAQVDKIISAGVKISHIDGHHFIHQAVFMIPLLPKLCNDIGVYKFRNYRNYMPSSVNRGLRNLWFKMIQAQNSKTTTTDWFTAYKDFYLKFQSGKHYYGCDDTIELMCHPGIFVEEEDLLLSVDPEKKLSCVLINYNQL